MLFIGSTQSGCGIGQAAMGPFYCSLDSTAYLDLEFSSELHQRFGAPGDFAQAYVIAHELGHHIQNLTGISSEVRRLSEEHPDDVNKLSIAQELQADCLAGVWGYSTTSAGSSSLATWRKRSPPRPPSATIDCNARPRAAPTSKRGPTARPSSASPGSAAASIAATPPIATPSATRLASPRPRRPLTATSRQRVRRAHPFAESL